MNKGAQPENLKLSEERRWVAGGGGDDPHKHKNQKESICVASSNGEPESRVE